MTIFLYFFALASVIWFSGYFTGRDAEQKQRRTVEGSLGRSVMKTKGL